MTADEMGRLLDELGKRLGPSGEHVFELAVRQVYIEAVFGLLLAAVLVAGAVWLWRAARKADSMDSGPMRGISWGLAGLALLVGGLFVIPVLNPEYAALSNILSRISS